MNRNCTLKLLFFLSGLLLFLSSNAQVAINATGGAPNSSAMLDISSTTKGLLIPSMTLAQRDLIASPATGLLVFQTNGTAGFYYFSGSDWQPVGGELKTSGNNIYYSGGNVGIGTASPGNKLEVNSGTAGTSGLRFTQLTAGSIPFINSTKDIAQNNALFFWDATNNRLGVGTATPGNRFELNSGTAGVSGFRISQLTAGSIPFISSTKDIAQNNASFFWDATNSRLGVGTATPNSTVSVNGSYTAKFVTVTANYTVLATDYTIIAKPSASNITITLPAAASSTGRIYIIKRVSANRTVTIKGRTSEQIDGANNYVISSNYNSLMIQSDGTAWYIIANR